MIPSAIATERLTLSPLQVGDAIDMVEVLGDSSLYAYTGGEPPLLDELEARYRRQLAGPDTPGESWLNWIIRTSADGRAVGYVQATVTGLKADLAWVIAVNHQGDGIATEAVGAAKNWLTDNGIGRIEAHINPNHEASQKVAERIGLWRTGTFDEDGEELWAAAPAPAWDNLS